MALPPKIVWLCTKRTVDANCVDCGFRELGTHVGVAREHIQANPLHLVQVVTRTFTEMFLPGREESTDASAPTKVRASSLHPAG